MNVIKEINRINDKEAALGIDISASWHVKYRDSAYVYVGGLDYDLTEGDVISVFSQWGEIMDVNLIRDKDTGKSKGFCFIAYEDQRSTVLAVDNFNGITLVGRIIRVDHVANYKPPKEEDENEKKKRSGGKDFGGGRDFGGKNDRGFDRSVKPERSSPPPFRGRGRSPSPPRRSPIRSSSRRTPPRRSPRRSPVRRSSPRRTPPRSPPTRRSRSPQRRRSRSPRRRSRSPRRRSPSPRHRSRRSRSPSPSRRSPPPTTRAIKQERSPSPQRTPPQTDTKKEGYFSDISA